MSAVLHHCTRDTTLPQTHGELSSEDRLPVIHAVSNHHRDHTVRLLQKVKHFTIRYIERREGTLVQYHDHMFTHSDFVRKAV